MSGVKACLQPTEGPACVGRELYGEIRGSSPNWSNNFCDKGRSHLSGPASDLGSRGLAAWDKAPAPRDPGLRRHYEQVCSSSYSEPTVVGGHGSYYGRRTMGDDTESTTYRRTLKHIPEPVRPERPEDEVRYRPAGAIPEPPLPRLGRPDGITGLRETDKEVNFEATMGRKVRVGQDSYRGSGRAGDRSLVYGAPQRVEDDPSYYRSMKDAPTFVRFCNSLPPKPAVSPHQRRDEGARRQAEQERRREAALVSTLTIEGVPDDD
ncbi:hypothetical protein VOLCADRAFT_103801 [Volvox carteri f. nagariensis]|uniref:Uncharacterized protein n=1 Tax=Volvox carteri f. nagariensis TaxID=3068 RepID=D8TP99_VOLCA|nr:uncharacterized protein VOLCADRAFT_103801 [Volvox carteri f. nagariensis]EFJ50584.1 hypothetical protein VOLCADRAFT_103801 [Volvox carteri f. nagariensis]|eukprot:XP_002948177.1 hypothetical protein VOLCADRAFT_103801 [Volvox carteri f. nagariensis]